MVHEDELPIRETNPLRPLSPYAVSKVAQDMLAYFERDDHRRDGGLGYPAEYLVVTGRKTG